MSKFSILIIFLITILGCGREKLTPLYDVKTVNQLKNNQPIYFSYQIDETQIDEYAKNTGKFPIFGKLFQAIAVVLANSTISNEGGHELELGAIDADLSSLSSIDFKYLTWIKLNSLLVEIRDSRSKDNLKFIDKIEIYAKLSNELSSDLHRDENGFVRLLYFDRNLQSLECDNKCLHLNQDDGVDWKSIMSKNKIISIHPKIVIHSVPLSSMKLAGSVDFSVKFDVGF